MVSWNSAPKALQAQTAPRACGLITGTKLLQRSFDITQRDIQCRSQLGRVDLSWSDEQECFKVCSKRFDDLRRWVLSRLNRIRAG